MSATLLPPALMNGVLVFGPTSSVGTAGQVLKGDGAGGTSFGWVAYSELTGLPSLGSAAFQNTSAFMQPSNNLSDLISSSTARINLGLGTAAVQNSGTFLQTANNLSDVVAATARTNLGLVASATTDTTNASNITTGTLNAARLPAVYAPIASPGLTGTPTAPTATVGTNTTQLATTEFVQSALPAVPVSSVAGKTGAVTLVEADISGLVSNLALKAALASPAFTGTPTAPTATAGTNTTQLATTAFVQEALGGGSSAGFPTIFYFGDGSDGAVTISSGTTTLTRDMFYSSLTISGTGQLNTAGFRVFVNGILDLSSAGAGAIVANGGNGGNGSATGTAGTTAVAGPNGYTLTNTAQNAAGAGTTTVGAAAGASGVALPVLGGGTAAGGTGGTGTSGNTGGAGTVAATPAGFNSFRRFTTDFPRPTVNSGFAIHLATVRTSSGGGGGGDGTVAGGGGGASGGGGGCIWISAATIARGTNSTAAIIQCKGGNGGNGGSPASGNASGGGGGAGGPGGFAYICFGSVTGSSIPAAVDVSGGPGGDGGTGRGTALLAARGGGSGGSGRFTLINLTAGTSVEIVPIAGTSGGVGSGLTGGAGAAATVSQGEL
jgi:hypothetical protein